MLNFLLTAALLLASEGEPPRIAGNSTAVDSLPYMGRDTLSPQEEIRPAEPEVVPVVWLVSRDGVDRQRLAELAGERPAASLLLRSPSALLGATTQGNTFRILAPEIEAVDNSALPFSINDGGVWAGRGLSARISTGLYMRWRWFRLMLAPEYITAANDSFELRLPIIERPTVPPGSSPWQFEWYVVGPYSIDMPTRFGDELLRRYDYGQSSFAFGGPVEFGVGTESNWWGPGINNALLLSDNAGGFPHLFFRSTRPLRTPLGMLEFRWLVGALEESEFFDTTSSNDFRSLSAAAITLGLRRPAGLTIGLARSVWGTASKWEDAAFRWFEVFHSTGRPNNLPLSDSLLYPGGRDQLFSAFARWVFPAAGFETYAEWGRAELPSSIGDFFTAPNHSQAYTIGVHWRRRGFRPAHFWRLHAENTSVEQSATFRSRPLGVWYTSRRVIQGYTHRGQVIGAAVGPGSSGQSLAIDYFQPHGSFGFQAGRMRFNEDVRSISPIFDFKRWCSHDMYLYWGPRATAYSRFGFASIDLKFANRYQPWFQIQSGCPRGTAMLDIRNNTFSVTLAPFRRR